MSPTTGRTLHSPLSDVPSEYHEHPSADPSGTGSSRPAGKNLAVIPRKGKRKETRLVDQINKEWKWHHPRAPTTRQELFKYDYGSKAKIRKRKVKEGPRRKMNRSRIFPSR